MSLENIHSTSKSFALPEESTLSSHSTCIQFKGPFSQECFWQDLSRMLSDNSTWKEIEIEGHGMFSRAEIEKMINFGIVSTPEKIGKFAANLKEYESHIAKFGDVVPADLHKTIIADREDLISLYLQTIHPDVTDSDGSSALHYAAFFGNEKIID